MKGIAALCVLLCGCGLYFGDGDDDPPCAREGDGAKPSPPLQEVRDPSTGVCQYADGGGGGWCEDECGPCYYDEPAIATDWAACYGKCFDLGENECFTTSGCYASYIEDPAADGKRNFWGCWDTAPSGPVQGGGCLNLDAYGCSRHDDCIAVYYGRSDSTNTAYEGTKFAQCAPELVFPEPIECAAVATEAACIARADCIPMYEGSDCTCGPNGCTCQTLTYDRCEAL
ncbi:MAG TPA: hypothetical protein VIV11_40560 [Kofleriaceae bacterium]